MEEPRPDQQPPTAPLGCPWFDARGRFPLAFALTAVRCPESVARGPLPAVRCSKISRSAGSRSEVAAEQRSGQSSLANFLSSLGREYKRLYSRLVNFGGLQRCEASARWAMRKCLSQVVAGFFNSLNFSCAGQRSAGAELFCWRQLAWLRQRDLSCQRWPSDGCPRSFAPGP